MGDGKPFLVIGAGGMLGRAWLQLLEARRLDVIAPKRDALDITSADAIAAHITCDTPIVINCAGWTDVDGAEDHETEATAINGDAVRLLASRCAEVNALLVHYSTDYVFCGDASRPYAIDAPTAPIGAYGRSKRAGETALAHSPCRHLLVRTSWLYAPWGKNFVRTIARLAAERPTLRVVNDQRGRPTSCEHLAATTLALIERHQIGTFHVTDGGACTWFEFAREIAGYINPDCTVEPCTTAEFPRPAKRPAYSVLDLGRTEALLGPMPDWRDNLADVVRQLEPRHGDFKSPCQTK